MGRRLRKADLLEEIDRERRALDEALAGLSPRQMTKAGVTRGGWSVKDVLALVGRRYLHAAANQVQQGRRDLM